MSKLNNQTIQLKDLQDLLSNKGKYFTNATSGHQGVGTGNWNGVQGEYNETFKFYKHPGLPEGVFMRETYQTDSYGGDDRITAVDFVEGKSKTVTVFEPI